MPDPVTSLGDKARYPKAMLWEDVTVPYKALAPMAILWVPKFKFCKLSEPMTILFDVFEPAAIKLQDPIDTLKSVVLLPLPIHTPFTFS